MTESAQFCSRCGLEIMGAPSYILMECDEMPPKQPELWLCQPCMASLNRWLLQRQRTAKDEALERMRASSEESGAPVRRRRSREFHEKRIQREMQSGRWKEALKIVRIAFVLGTILLVFIAVAAFVFTPTLLGERR
ncbi:MAG: hypothetical protein U0794_01535 [Isosphaeraceae bacterium]